MKRATPADAKRVWETMARPSSRRVATALNQAGFEPVCHWTINEWRKAEWTADPPVRNVARESAERLDDASPLLTGDPTTKAKDIAKDPPKLRGKADPETLSADQQAVLADLQVRALLDKMTDHENVTRSAVERAKTNIMVERAIQRNVDFLVKFFPEQLGTLIERLAKANSAIRDPFDAAHHLAGAGMKTIDAEPSTAMGDALKAFKRAKANGVHA